MVILAWIIGIVMTILSLLSLWVAGFLVFLGIGTFLVLDIYLQMDFLTTFGEDTMNMLHGAFVGPWAVILVLTIISNIFSFGNDVGKAVRNFADDDK
jgi:hypothetical protein